MIIRFCTLLLAFFTLAGPAIAQTAHIRASLEAETLTPAYGQDVTIAIRMTPESGWHGYWQNPGDAGAAPTFEWSLPKGATLSAPAYPVPEKLLVADLMNHVFNGEHALLYKLRLPQLPAGTPIALKAKGQWLACTDEICVPEGGDVALNLTIGDGRIDAASRTRFDGWRAKLPRPLGSAAAFAVDGKTLRIAVPYPENAAVTAPWFFAATENAVSYSAPQTVRRAGDMLIVETQIGDAVPKAVAGVLAIGDGKGLVLTAAPGAVPSGGNVIGEAARAATVDWQLILLSIAGAILGGLILNIMPCVFPIVSLKALSLAKAGGAERAAKTDALAYSAGVIATCLALGGALLAIRAGGAQVGWAFQLQDPRVIFALLLLTAAITLNLLGVFHLRGFGGGEALAGQGGTAGAFWTGALAAFVATPCTGPFMAAALGAALVLPVPAALGIFAGLGLGMALPFLALGFVPALRSRMPRPGAWMVTFQRWMALPMALTVAALLWLLWRQTALTGLMIGIAAVAVVALVAWFSGRKSGGAALMPVFASVAAALIVGAAVMPSVIARDAAVMAGAEAFSEAKLVALRQAERPVFLYFTADWCLTCKVNEKAAIDRDEVRDAFAAKNVAVMVGDWTNGDPAITRFLEAQGRSGVPLYLYYAKGVDQPQILPQVLTPGALTALVGS
jgi:thiol:disulfide interchange protein